MQADRLQSLLNRALASGNYTDVARLMAQLNHETITRYTERCLCPDGPNAGKPHEFKTTYHPNDLWPEKCACVHCGKTTPIEFCRKPLECVLAGRCCAEYACND